MASQNPSRASELVQKAQKKNTPVVSTENSGYGGNSRIAAVKRSMPKPPKLTQSQPDTTVQQRKDMEY